MLRPLQMSSVIITAPNSQQEAVIEELHSLKILHIVDHRKNEQADIGNPLENAAMLSENLVKVRALVTSLNLKMEDSRFEIKQDFNDVQSTIEKLNEEAGRNLDKLRKTDVLIAKNEAVLQELEILKNINVPLEAFVQYKSLTWVAG